MAVERVAEGIHLVDSGRRGRTVAIAFGVHGDERAPIDAGEELLSRFRSGVLALEAGALLLVHGNPRATREGRRATEGGVDLNRCFHADVLAREPSLYEEERAREITAALERFAPEALVDFHCTVEPGERFLMHHPPATDPGHERAAELLSASVVLADPSLIFGGVSLDEWMSTRGRVGICYETGWMKDPGNTPQAVLSEMENLLRGLSLLPGEARRHPDKERLELDGRILCEGEGFRWREGVGLNLQEVAAGSVLGAYADGREVRLERDAVLVFPKKRPELVEPGKPLVYLASRR